MTDHQHPTAKPEANWRTCSRAEYDALPDLSAKPEGEGTPVEQVKAQELLANNNRRMDAYYYGFDPTGVPEIDAVLSAVATAGKAYHHTDSWSDDDCGFSYSGLIQAAANLAASRLSASPPVPAVAGDTRPVEATWSDGKTHAYVNMQAALSAEAKEWRRKIGLRIVSFTFLDFDTSPTPSADQSGVIGALVEALKRADEGLASVTAFEDDARYIMGNTNFEITKRAREQVKEALAAHAASIEGKS